MAFASDDLTPLLAPSPKDDVKLRAGVVVSWDSATASNEIDVDGVILTDVPVLSTTAPLIAPGDVVQLLVSGRSWLVLGRVMTPGTPTANSP